MTELGIGHSLILLRSEGDEVEKHACDVEALAPLIGRYAAIWANYVRPKRRPSNPALIQSPINDLAERQYTALVRLLGALDAATRISDVSIAVAGSRPNGSTVVSMQSDLLTFFSSAGAAVESLENAYAAEPLISKEPLMPAPADAIGSPKWFYDRRTQYVHKRLLPVFEVDGLLHLDVAHFIDKDVTWNESSKDAREVSAWIEQLTPRLVSGLTNGWSRLYTRLRSASPIAFGGATPTVSFTSGAPRGG